jgi:D-3-phosphoglycerate dehydrogenase / 2-oxoglutarate reductase
MPKPRVLLTFGDTARRNYYGEAALGALRALAEVRLHQGDLPLAGEALVQAAQGCRAIVSDRQAAAPADLFRALPELAVFLRCAVDARNIDLAAASEAGVLVTHARAGYGNAVAEWVLGAMIDLARHMTDSVMACRSGGRPPVRMGSELRGATLGVIGYGVIGQRLAAIGDCMGMRVLVTDPVAAIPAPFTAASLDQLLPQADHVVCLAPARPDTENLMDARRFAAMKRGAFFINASRGELVDEAALLGALDSGHLGGCALDVGRAADQMPSSALAMHPRVIATPHVAGLTPAAVEFQANETVEQLAELLAGRVPVGALNAAHATRLHLLQAD